MAGRDVDDDDDDDMVWLGGWLVGGGEWIREAIVFRQCYWVGFDSLYAVIMILSRFIGRQEALVSINWRSMSKCLLQYI